MSKWCLPDKINWLDIPFYLCYDVSIMKTKKLSRKEIDKMISDTRMGIDQFYRDLKHAPPGKEKNEFKRWVRTSRLKLDQLEKTLIEGTWKFESK